MRKIDLKCSLVSVVSCAVLVATVWCANATLAADPDPGQKVVQEIRAALAARDFDLAKSKLKEAATLDDEARPEEELARLETLFQYTNEFWKAVNDGAKTLRAADELVIGDTITAVVEFNGNMIVLRVNGKNVRYTQQTVPAKVALTLAERVLKASDSDNKAIIAAFLLTDGKGSRALAEKYLKEAQQGGTDVAAILPELKLAPTIVLDVPAMTPLMQRALAPASWMLHTPDGKKIARKPLGEVGKLNEAGRLVVTLPEGSTGPAQVVFGRRLSGDFRCQVLIEDATAGQRMGLFSPNDAEDSFTVSLPAGQVKAEFVRQGDKLLCRINGAEAKLESPSTSRTRMAGLLGVELTPGQSCTILWFELAGR